MSDITFRIAAAGEYPDVAAAYAAWGYRGGVLPNDIVYVAEMNRELVATVRRTCEHGIVMLRGMYVAPQQQRLGIGSQLLTRFVNDLHHVVCYCVPLAHLQTVYGRGGFGSLPDNAAPEFLQERLAKYRAD